MHLNLKKANLTLIKTDNNNIQIIIADIQITTITLTITDMAIIIITKMHLPNQLSSLKSPVKSTTH